MSQIGRYSLGHFWQGTLTEEERGRLCTLDLLVLTGIDKLLFILNILFTFLNKLP